jgi:hypothetical protein
MHADERMEGRVFLGSRHRDRTEESLAELAQVPAEAKPRERVTVLVHER